MARPVDEEVLDLVKSGQATEVADNKFGKRVRNVDQDPLDEGDQFIIPAAYKVLQAPITAGDDPVKFILVPVTNKHTGVTRNIRFFPNQLAKVIFPIVNGKMEAKVKTGGTAAKEYQKFSDQGDEGMDNAMKALAGRQIEITSKTPYTVYAFRSTEETTTNIFTYDFV